MKSGYNKWLRPSTDRIDNLKSYTFNNIQIVTYKENVENERRDIINGKINVGQRPVMLIDRKTGKKKKYASVAEASRKSGLSQQRIRNLCKAEYICAYINI